MNNLKGWFKEFFFREISYYSFNSIKSKLTWTLCNILELNLCKKC